MNGHRLETFSFIALFFVVGAVVYFVFAPFFQCLTFAAILAIFFHKPYKKLTGLLGNSQNTAAFVTTLLVLLFVVVPLLLIGWRVGIEAQGLLTSLNANGTSYIQSLQASLTYKLHHLIPGISFGTVDFIKYIQSVVAFIAANASAIVTGTFSVITQTLLMLLAFFFFLRDGDTLVKALKHMSPFRKHHTHSLFSSIKESVESIVKGTLLVALIRWICIVAGFYVFGVPNAILWGSIAGIVGALPGFGTLMVFIPTVAYFYITGDTTAALGLALLAVAVIIAVDDVLTAYFFGKGLKQVPAIFVLFSILGGVIYFGPLGFVLGPLALSVFLSLLSMYGAMAKEQHATEE